MKTFAKFEDNVQPLNLRVLLVPVVAAVADGSASHFQFHHRAS